MRQRATYRGAEQVDPVIRTRMLQSLYKAGDTSTLQVARDELTQLLDYLYTPHESRSFCTILVQTTSLYPLLMRKTTFLLIDRLFEHKYDLVASSFAKLLTYMCKRMSDPEITQETYYDQISKTFRAFYLAAKQQGKGDYLFRYIAFQIQKQSIQTQIIALNGLYEMVGVDPYFYFVHEAGELCVAISRQLHDGTRQRLQYCSLRCISVLLDIGFDHGAVLQIASKSLDLRYFRTRETAYLILEKMVLLDRLSDKIALAKQLFVKIQQKKYDQVAQVRIQAFRTCQTFKELLYYYDPEWVEKVASRSASRAGSRDGVERATFRDFRDRIAISKRSPGTHTLGNVQDPDADEYDFCQSNEQLTRNIVPINEAISQYKEIVSDFRRSSADQHVPASIPPPKPDSPVYQDMLCGVRQQSQFEQKRSNQQQELSLQASYYSSVATNRDADSRTSTNQTSQDGSVSLDCYHTRSVTATSTASSSKYSASLSRTVASQSQVSDLGIINESMDIDAQSVSRTSSSAEKPIFERQCYNIYYFGELPVNLMRTSAERCAVYSGVYKAPQYVENMCGPLDYHLRLSVGEFTTRSAFPECAMQNYAYDGFRNRPTSAAAFSSANQYYYNYVLQLSPIAPESNAANRPANHIYNMVCSSPLRENKYNTGNCCDAVPNSATRAFPYRPNSAPTTAQTPNMANRNASDAYYPGFSFASNASAVAFSEAYKGNLNCAYASMLLRNDAMPRWKLCEETLRLMCRTGACIPSLDDDVVLALSQMLADLLEKGFVDQVIPWIGYLLYRRGVFGPEIASQLLSGLSVVWQGHSRWPDCERIKRYIYYCYPYFEPQ